MFALGGFGFWSGTAPIAGAVVANGVFVTDGQNKTIQHLEGGVIREILVREGNTVEAGQPLILLDDTAPRAELRRLTLRQARLSAMEARLLAESRDEEQIAFPLDLSSAAQKDPDIAGTILAQRNAFEARRNNLRSETATLKAGIDALAK